MNKIISVNQLVISQEAKDNVNEALDSNWISSSGKFVKEFEDKLKKEEEAKKAKETEKNNAKVQEEFTKSKLDDVIEQIKKEEDKK